MTPASRGISPGLVESTQDVDERGALGLESQMRSRSIGIRLNKEPVVNLDESDFDDFEDSKEGPDLGLEEETESLLDCLRTRHERVGRSLIGH